MAKNISFLLISLLFTNLVWSIPTYTTFSASDYTSNTTQLDSTLGITNEFVIEEFDDVNLMSWLSVSYENDTFSALGSTYSYSNTTWGPDSYVLCNSYNNSGDLIYRITFHIDGYATSVGMGLGQFELRRNPNTNILINGEEVIQKLGDLPDYDDALSTPSGYRNMYIMFNAAPGEFINEITFDLLPVETGDMGGDWVTFDHLAVKFGEPIPEPSGFILLGFSLLFYSIKRK